ncbi:MAG TPA: DUF4911 domain-containing protein [Firmicutes bacterium]|nr:DUF4911 domain-containing protein [Bacillota bacterium]
MSIEPFTLHVQTAPHHIDFLNRVFEAYDHLAIVSTLDNQEGIVAIRGFGKVGPVRRILRGLPFSAKIVYNSAEDVTK